MVILDDEAALLKLGAELEEVSWSPENPIVAPFDKERREEERRRILLAMAFLSEYREDLQKAVCDGSSVRDEVQTVAAIAAALGDSAAAASGFPVPVMTIANTLAQLGLARFCKIGN